MEKYNEFYSLLNGEKEDEVTAVLEERKEKDTTLAGLESLQKMAKELTSVTASIKASTQDLSFFPMFMVNCFDVKAKLVRISDSLLGNILTVVASDNTVQMTRMGQEYQDIVNTLVTDPADADELKGLQEYAAKSIDDLSRLLDEYLNEIYERCRFLLDQHYRVSRDDLQLFYTTYSWPNQVKTFMQRSQELQNSRKRDLELVVEGQQEQLAREISSLDRKVEKLTESGSLAPNDVQNVWKRITNIVESLVEAEAEAENIAEQEKLLEIPSADNLTEIKRVKAALAPLERMWGSTKDYVEKKMYWDSSPLGEISPEDAERDADDLHRAMIKIAKELERAGESRGITKRAALQMREEIKNFLEQQIPVMLLVCNPGLRDRHWQQMESITGLTIPVSASTNMAQMTELGLHHHVAAIEETCVAASKENTLENGMDKMEVEWSEIEFGLKAHKVSERSERALMKTRILAKKSPPAKWLHTYWLHSLLN